MAWLCVSFTISSGAATKDILLFADDAAMFAARAKEIEEIGTMIFLWVA